MGFPFIALGFAATVAATVRLRLNSENHLVVLDDGPLVHHPPEAHA